MIPDYIDGNPVREIGRGAFAGHHTITSVTIPETVDTIHDRAFYNCDGLTEVVLPTSVLVIGEEAFAACSFLKTVVSEGGLEIVRNLAFANCISLETVTFPDSVTGIDENLFKGCVNLTDIYCQAASQPAGWHAGWANNCAALVHWGYDIPCEHNFTKNVTVFATCEEDGYKVTVCKNCAAELFREEYKALGHDIEHRDGKAVTCTENGWNAYEACTRCAYSTYEEIPATGHEYAETVTEPLCTVPGKIHHACIYCDRAYAEYIPAKGHDYVGGICTACGKSLIAEYGIDLSVSDATAFAGETVTVEVTLDKNVGFTYLNLLFDYDADCTGDGKINGKDVTRLLRYLASFDPMTGESSVVLGATEKI